MNEILPTDSNSQRQRILAWLRERPLTTLQARKELDIMHPAARVQELRELGNRIITYWHVTHSDSGTKHRVGRYVLLANP